MAFMNHQIMVLNQCMDPRTFETQMPPIVNASHLAFIPRQLSPSGFRKDCIRLRGLPYEAKVTQILEFLGKQVNNIVFQGVHLIYTVKGKTSGDAFIQMDSEHSAYFAAKQRHFQYMIFGRKLRYIEVYQCSVNDMNLALMGGIPVQKKLQYPEETLFSQHYVTYPYQSQTTHVLPTAAPPIQPRIPSPLNYSDPFNLIYLPQSSQSIYPTTCYTHLGPAMYISDCIQIQQNGEGNPFAERPVTLASRPETELALQVKNFQDICNPYILFFSPSYEDIHYQSY